MVLLFPGVKIKKKQMYIGVFLLVVLKNEVSVCYTPLST